MFGDPVKKRELLEGLNALGGDELGTGGARLFLQYALVLTVP